MLVLTRPDGDGLLLALPDGEQVRIFMERTGHKRVKAFIDAPRSISISRIDKNGTIVGNKTCPSTKTTTPTSPECQTQCSSISVMTSESSGRGT